MQRSIEIVIVDDQVEMINSIKPFFEIQPHFIIKGTANSGIESISLIKNIHADVVLMDIKMETPKAGLDAAETLLLKHKIDTDIIFLTAYPNTEDVKRARDLGCSFVDKKCSIPRIIQIIEEVVYHKKLIIEIQSP